MRYALTAIFALSLALTCAAEEAPGKPGIPEDFGDLKLTIHSVKTDDNGNVVVGGIVVGGTFRIGDTICVIRTNGDTHSVTVKGIRAWNKDADSASIGQSAALQLSGITKDDVGFGDRLRRSCE